MQADIALRLEVEALYARSATLLNEGPLSQWPSLFGENGSYKATSRENIDRGWPLALMVAESRAAIEDRVNAIENLSLTVPRRIRHIITGIQVEPAGDNRFKAEANFAVFETLEGQQTVCFATGRYRDVLTREDGRLVFLSKLAICDAALIRNSLVYPL
jgi:3-phenylpropionate/cinnamic acid dioxygenase small subunit